MPSSVHPAARGMSLAGSDALGYGRAHDQQGDLDRMGMTGLLSRSPISNPASSGGAPAVGLAVSEAGPAVVPRPRLLDRVREAIRTRHYSRSTEQAYVHWIKRYVFFHRNRQPA